jgi:D-alanyl-D-alanine carboxypeptidase
VGAEGSRFRVEAPGLEGGGVEGWIDVDDCGFSGPPPPWVRTTQSTMLYGHPLSSEGVLLLADVDLMIVGEPIHDLLHVYWPAEIAPRRGISSGWIEANAVESSVAPQAIGLPAPSFRAVPARRAGTYRVRPGDSIASVSAMIGLPADELARRNGLDAQGTLLVGQLLQVGTPASAAQADGSGPTLTREVAPGWISAEYAVVIDGDSGRILWGREPNSPVPPASVTKILTAALVLDYARLSDPVTVRVDSRRMPGSTVMGLHPGETLTVEDLLYGMMLPSGNDAALALAHHVAGTQEAFADLMNEKMRSLGLTDSQFANPHGLDAPGHVSTAYDMAMLTRSAMDSPVFRALAVARDYETPRGRGYEVYNLNQLLWRYPGADGVKIGYTPAAGRTIVASASRDGRRVYVALMRSNDIYADSTVLLDWAFASHSWR